MTALDHLGALLEGGCDDWAGAASDTPCCYYCHEYYLNDDPEDPDRRRHKPNCPYVAAESFAKSGVESEVPGVASSILRALAEWFLECLCLHKQGFQFRDCWNADDIIGRLSAALAEESAVPKVVLSNVNHGRITMGYDTQFEGNLAFESELTGSQLARLNMVLGIDVREHPEFRLKPGGSYYINLELNEDFSGISWDNSEKTYDMPGQVNAVIEWMRQTMPGFGLKGELIAQGEDTKDRWILRIRNGTAIQEDIKIEGSIYRCPHCGGKVITSEAEEIEEGAPK